MNYLQSCFLLDYGNRTPIKNLLLKFCKLYYQNSTRIGLIFYVNNNPYSLEFYLSLEVEFEYIDIFNNIKSEIETLSIKELSSISNINLMSDMSGRRFNSQNSALNENFINDFFSNYFVFPERSELIKKGYRSDFNTFYPNTIFFSYSNKQLIKLLDNVISKLNAESFPVFFDRKSLFISSEINKEIKTRIKECKFIIFFIDQNFLNSSYCKKELHWAKYFKVKSMFIVDKNVKFDHPNLFIHEQFSKLDVNLVYKSIKEFIFV